MNGLELQRELASAGFGIPIVFITAYDNKDARRQAMRGGAVAFLDKPFDDKQLLQTVRAALTAGGKGENTR
jgi:FixJ family two-component response regulator